MLYNLLDRCQQHIFVIDYSTGGGCFFVREARNGEGKMKW
jgi:hypothetical protein